LLRASLSSAGLLPLLRVRTANRRLPLSAGAIALLLGAKLEVPRLDRLRSIVNGYSRRVGLVAPGGAIVPGQDGKHSCVRLDRLHCQTARQKA
jgi:hypothetical protein